LYFVSFIILQPYTTPRLWKRNDPRF